MPEDEESLNELTVAWRKLKEVELLTRSGYKTFQVENAIDVKVVSYMDKKRRVYPAENWSIRKFTPNNLQIQLDLTEAEKYTVMMD